MPSVKSPTRVRNRNPEYDRESGHPDSSSAPSRSPALPEAPADPPSRSEFERYIAQLRTCRSCPGVFPPPVVGPVHGCDILLIGQAPGPREMEAGRPFVWTAGKTLFRWLASIGVAEDDFREKVHMGAVIRCFPGKMANGQGDRKPSRSEIENCRHHYQTELQMLRPGLVLLVGKLAIEQFIPHRRLDEVVGRSFSLQQGPHAFTAVPLPHPSGLSRWIQTDAGKALLAKGLALIEAHPAWRSSFTAAQS